MQRTHSFARLFAQLALGTFLLAATTPLLQAADASGTWTWTTAGRDGGEGRKSTLKLKVDGEKVTGTISSPGRQGGQAREVEISDGKIKGDELSFAVVREFNGNKMTQKFSGKVTGDAIKGKIESEREGNTRSRDWEAKREGKEAK
jgi:hypothetical protein